MWCAGYGFCCSFTDRALRPVAIYGSFRWLCEINYYICAMPDLPRESWCLTTPRSGSLLQELRHVNYVRAKSVYPTRCIYRTMRPRSIRPSRRPTRGPKSGCQPYLRFFSVVSKHLLKECRSQSSFHFHQISQLARRTDHTWPPRHVRAQECFCNCTLLRCYAIHLTREH